ncbi:tetratricopeptide repeat protein [Leisingera sp. S232]|uniref:tetratricopeptide repeat protein n=1 Tax=Leisingera sp. S232 TaxID=3415132 RepID=UPI003C7B4FB2
MTLGQGQALAAHALENGNPKLALQLSDALLEANRKNHIAWHLQAAAYAQTGRPAKGRQAAARAFRYAPDSAAKFQIGQLASRLAFQGGSPVLSQYWLRRTAVHAPDSKADALIAKDYKTLRRISPWSFRISGGVKPSNNVNSGSDAATQEIDGLSSHQNRLGPRAIALSGLIGTLDTSIGRRLRQSKTSLTSLSGRLYVQRVALSSSAKEEAAALAELIHTSTPRNREFGSTYGEITLSHAFAAGQADSGGSARIALTGATSWYGGKRNYNLVKLSGSRSWSLSSQNRLTVHGSAEHRLDPRVNALRADVFGLGASLSRQLENGNSLSFSFGLRDTHTRNVNSAGTSATMRIGYALAQAIGPAKVSTGLILGAADYPGHVFHNGFGWQAIPGGRQDNSLYADLNVFFEDYDYAGFAPMMRIRAGKRSSNHSRYDSSEFSISLGVESKF